MSIEHIRIEDCIVRYHIELSFVEALTEAGLIELERINQDRYLPFHQLGQLEKYINLHYELHINIEGLEALQHMTEKVMMLQEENRRLKNLLHIYHS